MNVAQLAELTIPRINTRPTTTSNISQREPTDRLLHKWGLKSCTA